MKNVIVILSAVFFTFILNDVKAQQTTHSESELLEIDKKVDSLITRLDFITKEIYKLRDQSDNISEKQKIIDTGMTSLARNMNALIIKNGGLTSFQKDSIKNQLDVLKLTLNGYRDELRRIKEQALKYIEEYDLIIQKLKDIKNSITPMISG